MKRLLLLVIALSLGAAPMAHATPLDLRQSAISGADHLMTIQNANGSFPWVVTDPKAYQNVQGVTAVGLVDAYKLSLRPDYLDAAKETRDWLGTYRNEGVNGACQGAAPVPPCRLSAPNIYFLGELAVVTGDQNDFTLARAALNDRIAQFGSPAGIVTGIIKARYSQGDTNLGLWDAALFVRAAQDIGNTNAADQMGKALATQTIVDPLDSGSNWYELGLAGVLMGLSESDWAAAKSKTASIAAALEAVQATDGTFPITYGGVTYQGDVQTTAYATIGLLAVAEVGPALKGADALGAVQRQDGSFPGSFDGSGDETGETDAEAISALCAAALPVPNGVLAYGDQARAAL